MARSRSKSRRRTGGHPARRTPVLTRRSQDGHGEMVRGSFRLRGATGDLADGCVELLVAAPLAEDSWMVPEQTVNCEVDLAGALAKLGEPIAVAALRNMCAFCGVPFDEVNEDPAHISQLQARALNRVGRDVGMDFALDFFAAIPTDELKALRHAGTGGV